MSTFAHAGRIDLWTRADAVAGSDDMSVTPIPEL